METLEEIGTLKGRKISRLASRMSEVDEAQVWFADWNLAPWLFEYACQYMEKSGYSARDHASHVEDVMIAKFDEMISDGIKKYKLEGYKYTIKTPDHKDIPKIMANDGFEYSL